MTAIAVAAQILVTVFVSRLNHTFLLTLALLVSISRKTVALGPGTLTLRPALLLVSGLTLLAHLALVFVGSVLLLAAAAFIIPLTATAVLLLTVLLRFAVPLRLILIAQAFGTDAGLLLAELVEFALILGARQCRYACCSDHRRDNTCGGSLGPTPAGRGLMRAAILQVALFIAAIVGSFIVLVIVKMIAASIITPNVASFSAV
jgi:hypothetical protein